MVLNWDKRDMNRHRNSEIEDEICDRCLYPVTDCMCDYLDDDEYED